MSIAVGGFHSMFVKADGTLWNTGYNGNGELGNGTLIDTNQLTYLTNNVVTAIGGNRHSLFMKADGSLWTMGWNYYGTLGNGTSGNTKYTNAAAVKGGLLAACLANNSGCLNYYCLAIAGATPVAGALANQTVSIGQSASFTASVASGDGPFTYQWQKDGGNILNATIHSVISNAASRKVGRAFLPDLVGQEWPTYCPSCGETNDALYNAVYSLASAALADAGSYAVLVYSTFGTTSTNAVLTVNKATPTVTTWPTATAITYGQTLASSTLESHDF